MKYTNQHYVEIGELVTIEIAFSEAAMHMQVAGTIMQARLVARGNYWPAAQLYRDGQEYSFPITPGEAGFYFDSERKQFYCYLAEEQAQ